MMADSFFRSPGDDTRPVVKAVFAGADLGMAPIAPPLLALQDAALAAQHENLAKNMQSVDEAVQAAVETLAANEIPRPVLEPEGGLLTRGSLPTEMLRCTLGI